MLERPMRRTFSNTQVRRFLKRDSDERGVASTVGTIMALLVFLTFLTLFTNSYIPVWMTDNERSHMNDVMDQFGGLKSKVDAMVINAEVTGRTDLNMFAPITLGSAGIPIFASPTAGLLTYAPYSTHNSSVTVSFQYDIAGNNNNHKTDTGGGMVQLYAPNRYYVQQWVAYENGAILIKQTDGQAMRAFPSIDLAKPTVNSAITMSFTQIDLTGTNGSVSGTGTAGINIDLIYFDTQVYNNGTVSGNLRNNSITITFVTQYGTAWYNYLNGYLTTPGNNLMNKTQNPTNPDYYLSKPTPTKVTKPTDSQTFTLKVYHVSYFTYNRAIMQMTVQVS